MMDIAINGKLSENNGVIYLINGCFDWLIDWFKMEKLVGKLFY